MADPFVAGAVVVVVVAGAVIEALVTTRVVSGAFTESTVDAEVVGVTTLGGMVGNVVVVVVVVVGVLVDGEVGACGAACPSLDAVLPPRPLEWSDVAAATRARRDNDTARTAHQCGRIRCGRARPDARFVRSPATA
jgi:hypothetical protein